MFLVRYLALAALVMWLGGILTALYADVFRHFYAIAYASAGTIAACLLVAKFVGPPPRAFFLRGALVALMLSVAALSSVDRRRDRSMLLLSVDLAFGLALLSWYTRE